MLVGWPTVPKVSVGLREPRQTGTLGHPTFLPGPDSPLVGCGYHMRSVACGRGAAATVLGRMFQGQVGDVRVAVRGDPLGLRVSVAVQ